MSPKVVIRISILSFVIISIGLIVYAVILNTTPRGTLSITLSPDEATIIINGVSQPIKNQQKIGVAPGSIKIEIKRDEFDTYNTTLDIKNGETKDIIVSLAPQTDAARKIIENDTSQKIVEQVGGAKVIEGAAELREVYPILKSLPINDRFYRITSCSSQKNPDDPTKIAVCVNLFEMAAKQSATNEITSRGYVLSDYEIIYIDASFITTEANEYGLD